MVLESIFVCGGDLRSGHIAQYFLKKGYNVKTFGLKKEEETLDDAASCDIVIMGLPAVVGGFVNTPFSDKKITMKNLLGLVKKDARIFGGRFSEQDKKEAQQSGFTVFDYSEDEIFQTENALYTAEGALSAIIDATDISLCGMKILVTGSGRISKAFCSLASGAPCIADVYARSALGRSFFEMRGHTTLSELEDVGGYDVIVNTVPAHIFDENVLKTASAGTLVVDLSARPGYVDAADCHKYSLTHLYLPGIPSKSAPRSAGISAAKAVERVFTHLLTEGN